MKTQLILSLIFIFSACTNATAKKGESPDSSFLESKVTQYGYKLGAIVDASVKSNIQWSKVKDKMWVLGYSKGEEMWTYTIKSVDGGIELLGCTHNGDSVKVEFTGNCNLMGLVNFVSKH